ncbi:DUF6493 family protein [Streptomyces sp. NPDC057411]|uniref:DUF7824 domain-containing protein n=1 Tax=unclassified Streptomyces TaxID=2593676 RepID=UPI0036294869
MTEIVVGIGRAVGNGTVAVTGTGTATDAGTGTGAGTSTGTGTGTSARTGTGTGAGTAADTGAEVGGGSAAEVAVEFAAEVEQLLCAVRQGRHLDVPGLLRPLGPAGRKAAVPELKRLRKEVRGWDWQRGREQRKVQCALRLAGAGCIAGAAAAAEWIGGRDLQEWGDAASPVLGVLADRDQAWLTEVARRLAERPVVAEDEYALVHGLVRLAGCPAPATDAYVRGWTRQMSGRNLAGNLRRDPQTPVLAPRLLDLAEAPEALTWNSAAGPGQWPTALAALTEEGLLDRAALVDACVARLLRGGRPRDLRLPLGLLQLLGTTAEERRSRIPDWLGMVADAPSPVASLAQEVLTDLALDGSLPVRELAEMSGSALFRSEKKLVRAQLTLLTKVLRREPGAAAELLPVLTDAFGHEDTAIQERALKLVGRHLAAVDERVREELAGAAALLSPVHRAAAAELFGTEAVAEAAPYEEVLPPVPGPRPVAPAAGTVAELVEELVAHMRRPGEPEEFERALDGLVRHAHRDRAALTAAVREAFAGAYWANGADYFSYGPRGLVVALAALIGAVPLARIDDGRRRGVTSCGHQGPSGVVDARLWEAAWLIVTEAPVPFLLATPTEHTGAIDPVVLAERLREYRDAGVDPAPVDLAQALLRVRKADPAAARAAARASALGTRAGKRLAEWLTADVSLTPGVRFLTRGPDIRSGRWWMADRLVAAVKERRAIREEFPPAFRWLGGELTESVRRCRHWSDQQRHWPAVLPDDREVLAVWLLPVVAGGADWNGRGTAWGLTALAEGDGPVGPGVHAALAVGLGSRHAEDRLTAVDALLVLAARGELDPALLGTQLGTLLAEGTVKPNRLADATRTAAATGAYGTVWAVLAELLPGLLAAPKPPRGVGELLAVAAECVERCGAGRAVPGLAEAAARPGSSQAVVQARRLASALRQGTDQAQSQSV